MNTAKLSLLKFPLLTHRIHLTLHQFFAPFYRAFRVLAEPRAMTHLFVLFPMDRNIILLYLVTHEKTLTNTGVEVFVCTTVIINSCGQNRQLVCNLLLPISAVSINDFGHYFYTFTGHS